MAFLNSTSDPLVESTFAGGSVTENSENHRLDLLEEYQPNFDFELKDYSRFIGPQGVEELLELAKPLEGRGWVNVNSTFSGGGVAEMLRSAVPLARLLGVDAHWCTIRGSHEFFKVTKKFHDLLQGAGEPIELEELFGAYLDTIDENANNTMIAADLVVVHDPQPAAMVMAAPILGNVLWRCHIDTSMPDKTVWRFLLPYINHCDGAIFTMPEFVGPGLRIPVYQVMPCIDPLADKNHDYSDFEALEILNPLFNVHGVDPERPIFAAISRYDMHKNQRRVLEAFQLLRDQKTWPVQPYLIFVGNTATDDPDGAAVLADLKEIAGDDPDVHFWVNVENNDQVVGALMHVARAFVHVSTREGFGLVVSEALWQGTPVIGSRVGGIKQQVVDGENGYLVDPLDTQAMASCMARFLEESDRATAMGRKGREFVQDNFLLPDLVRRYLVLMRYYAGISSDLPHFRRNGLTHREVAHAFGRRHPHLPELSLINEPRGPTGERRL